MARSTLLLALATLFALAPAAYGFDDNRIPRPGPFVFVDGDGQLVSLPPAAGAEPRLIQSGVARFRTPRVSPDGRSVLYVTSTTGTHDKIVRSSVDGGAAEILATRTAASGIRSRAQLPAALGTG